MQFKTTIQIITEAKDKDEAMEIAGEYLSGNLNTGIDMQCRTAPVRAALKQTGIALGVILIVGLLLLHGPYLRHSQSFIQAMPETNVVQPPLKTSPSDRSSDFKKEWQARHTEEALNYIKK